MTPGDGPSARLGPRIGTLLRAGTLGSVAVIGLGWTAGLLGGSEGPGAQPVGALLAGGGGDAVASVGLLGLTLLPMGVLLLAGATFRADGERRYLLACVVTFTLLAASLVVSALVVGSS